MNRIQLEIRVADSNEIRRQCPTRDFVVLDVRQGGWLMLEVFNHYSKPGTYVF